MPMPPAPSRRSILKSPIWMPGWNSIIGRTREPCHFFGIASFSIIAVRTPAR